MANIILARWVAGRVRTPGRFWRTVRRIDARSIDLVTGVTRFLMLVACVLILIGTSGCSVQTITELGRNIGFYLALAGIWTAYLGFCALHYARRFFGAKR